MPTGPLRFKLFGADIQIRWEFWLVIGVLSFSTQRGASSQIALAGTLLTAIVAHELGHALMAKRLGLRPVIMIHAFGGLTTFAPPAVLTRSIAIRVMLAGPAMGLLTALGGLAVFKFAPLGMGAPWSSWARTSLVEFVEINAFWSVVNLLPVMPFDGGQVLVLLMGPGRRLQAAQIALVFGGLAAIGLYAVGLTVAAIIFAIASVVQYVASRRIEDAAVGRVPSREIAALAERARRALEAGDPKTALALGRSVVELAPTLQIRREAAEICAWAAIGTGDLGEARRALEWMSGSAIDPLLQAAVLEADGDAERAVHCLRQARVAGDARPQLAASLIRLLLGADRYGEAALTTIQILEHVSAEEARRVAYACRDGGRPVPAAELAEAIYSTTGDVSDLLLVVGCYLSAENRDAARSALAVALATKVSPAEVERCPEWGALREDDALCSVMAQHKAEAHDASFIG